MVRQSGNESAWVRLDELLRDDGDAEKADFGQPIEKGGTSLVEMPALSPIATVWCLPASGQELP